MHIAVSTGIRGMGDGGYEGHPIIPLFFSGTLKYD